MLGNIELLFYNKKSMKVKKKFENLKKFVKTFAILNYPPFWILIQKKSDTKAVFLVKKHSKKSFFEK
jgi:hypothetical protein